MSSIEMKIARHDIAHTKAKLAEAQTAHTTEVELLKVCESALVRARGDSSMTRFLELREMKRVQARVVRETFEALISAMNAVDDEESKYDLLVATQYYNQ